MTNSLSNENSEQKKWNEFFEEFEQDYKDAYFTLDEAIKLDEEGKTSEALPLYETGLDLVDKALKLQQNEPPQPDITWEKTQSMTQKLKKTRKEIVLRVENIQSKPKTTEGELPPSYEDAVAGSSSKEVRNNGNTIELPGPSNRDDVYIPPSAVQDEELLAYLQNNEQQTANDSVTYSQLSQQLKELRLAKNEEILFRCENVKLYFIAPDGRTSVFSESDTLIVARIHDSTCSILNDALLNIVSDLKREVSETKKKRHRHHHLHRKHYKHREKKYKHIKKDESSDQSEKTFLQVGSWIYPLIPAVSPCVRSEFGAFMLPDINSNIEGAAVGIVLPEEANGDFHELLTNLLNEISATGRSRRSASEASFFGDSYSSKFARGAAYLAHNLIRGAGSTARFFDSATPRIINQINPQPEPQPINPTLQKTVEVAKTVTGKAVDVTDYLASKIMLASAALGRYLSPYVQKQGTKLLTTTTGLSEKEANEKLATVVNATSEAVGGIYTIYAGLDEAAKILASSLANNTVQIIEHKYGHPAGTLTNDAITTVGNIYYTRHNFRVLKPKRMAKAAVRGAGSAILEDYKTLYTQSKNHDEFSGSGPGDGKGFSKT